jgi:hypothetical protein
MANIVVKQSVKVGEQFIQYALMDAKCSWRGENFYILMRRLAEVGQEAARAAVTAEYQRLCKANRADFEALGLVPDEQPATVPVSVTA